MEKSRVKRKIMWVLCFIAVLIAAAIVFFQIPYSPMRNTFLRDVQRHTDQSAMRGEFFTEQDIKSLPEPVQNHFRAAGIIGQPIMSKVSVHVPSAFIYQSVDSRPLILDYTVYLFAHRPVRIAYMNTSMFGIPFEAVDSFQNGEGVMRGAIGKVIPLFNQTGTEMDRGQLLTYLGEVFLLPSAILGDFITWEPIDANHAKATITYGELSGSGIFTFSDEGFVQSFRTDQRAAIHTDGTIEFLEWSAIIEGWKKGENGMYLPSSLKVVWHEPDVDFVYFIPNGDIIYRFN